MSIRQKLASLAGIVALAFATPVFAIDIKYEPKGTVIGYTATGQNGEVTIWDSMRVSVDDLYKYMQTDSELKKLRVTQIRPQLMISKKRKGNAQIRPEMPNQEELTRMIDVIVEAMFEDGSKVTIWDRGNVDGYPDFVKTETPLPDGTVEKRYHHYTWRFDGSGNATGYSMKEKVITGDMPDRYIYLPKSPTIGGTCKKVFEVDF